MEKVVLHYFELNTGARIPGVGLGTWEAPPGILRETVKTAVNAGYRHIDCAHVYDNEKEVGVALKELFSTGVVQRSEMFITSKLWCSDEAPEDVCKALSISLENLQLDYIDLYLIHWPFRTTKHGSCGGLEAEESLKAMCISETWNAMEGLYASGQARAIGVSNFSTKKLQDLIKTARVAPAVNQVECHPVWQQPCLNNLCKSTGVHLSAYSPPLGSQPHHILIKEPILIQIGEKLKKSPAQVALRWAIQTGHTHILIPNTLNNNNNINQSTILQNLSLFDWSIPPQLFSKFTQIHQQSLLNSNPPGPL